MKERLSKVPEIEQESTTLFNEKSCLLEQVGKLSMELKTIKESYAQVNKELATLTDKLNEVQKDNVDLKIENSKLVAKQTSVSADIEKAKQAVQAASLLKNENAQLKATIENLKANQTAPAVGGTLANGTDAADYKVKIQALEEQKAELQKGVTEWSELAKVRIYYRYQSDSDSDSDGS
jgi:chromosome segregation ATPase